MTSQFKSITATAGVLIFLLLFPMVFFYWKLWGTVTSEQPKTRICLWIHAHSFCTASSSIFIPPRISWALQKRKETTVIPKPVDDACPFWIGISAEQQVGISEEFGIQGQQQTFLWHDICLQVELKTLRLVLHVPQMICYPDMLSILASAALTWSNRNPSEAL